MTIRQINAVNEWPSAGVGIDGCPGGWIAVSRTGAWVNPSLAELLDRIAPEVIALDMPIGLPARGPRCCDQAARRLLGRPRAASVFPAPMRSTLVAGSHVEASDLNAAACGARMSAQTYRLLPKIREVDALLRGSQHWRERVYETHPEVSFAALNAGAALAEPKRRAAGRARRQALLAGYFGSDMFLAIRTAIGRRDAADDDIADAMACLFSAERIAQAQHRRLPESPPRDALGLPMQICY